MPSEAEELGPKVSILSAIYNCASTLPEALDSILSQTFQDWEMILCDDGSSDNTLAIAQSYAAKDSRFIVIQNARNLGTAAALNHCLQYAKGSYHARMDGDDRSCPNRLATLVDYLDSHGEYAFVSSGMRYFDEKGYWGEIIPNNLAPTPKDMSCGTPFPHAPAMVRKAADLAVQGYRTDIGRVEDYDLWVRLYAAGFRGANLPIILYEVREDQNTNARRNYGRRIDEAKVTWRACALLHLPWHNRLRALRPLLIGLLPNWLYDILRRQKHKRAKR